MMWFENIKQWFVDNSQTILAFLTPTNIAAVITAIVMTIRNRKSTKANIQVGNGLVSSIGTLDNLGDTIKDNTDMVSSYLGEFDHLDERVTDIEEKVAEFGEKIGEKFDAIEQKLVSMLEVQSLVYSTIQNDSLRVNVQNVIANAKISADDTRKALKQEVDNLKQQIVNITDSAKAVVEEKVEKIKNVANNKKASVRY